MDKFRAFIEIVAKFWRGLPTPKRLALVGLTGAVIAGVLLFTLVARRENYTYLYSGLSPEDANAIVEKLKAQQVPHKLDPSGSAIQVPDSKVAELRLQLAGAGLPRTGSVGFELFDKSQLGSTEFEQQINLKRALEGELVRSILTIQGVEAARVHLVVPERRLFAAREEAASASVVVKLRSPQAFGRQEVAGVVHLVSAAVPGLKAGRVSVVSTDGLTLHRPSEGNGTMGVDSAELSSERSRAVASEMEANVRSQLERVVGPGNADVRVHVDIDSAARETTEEHYEPSKTALRSEQKLEESDAAGNPGVAGVPGATTNLPDAIDGNAAATERTAGGPGGGNVFRRSQTRNWEVDRVARKTVAPPGEVRRVNVAVLLNNKVTAGPGAGPGVPRSPEELVKLESLVKRAVGFDEVRGDVVTVSNTEFAKLAIEDMAPQAAIPWWRKYLPHLIGAAILLALMALVVVLWRIKSNLAPAPIAQSPSVFEQLDAEAREAMQLPGGAPMHRLQGSQPVDTAQLRTEVLDIAQADAATAANVLRGWLNGQSPAQSSART
jgi:flagellar M-ring protein FliF